MVSLLFSQAVIARKVRGKECKNESVLVGIGLSLAVFSIFQSPPMYLIALTSGYEATSWMDWVHLLIWLAAASFWLYRIFLVGRDDDSIFKVMALNLLPLSILFAVVSLLLGGGWGVILAVLSGYGITAPYVAYTGGVLVLLLLYNFFFYYLYRGVRLYSETVD